MRLAMHRQMLPIDIIEAMQPPFTSPNLNNNSTSPTTTTTPTKGGEEESGTNNNNNNNGGSGSNGSPSVAMANNGRLTYCTLDVHGTGSICVQPSTICVVAAHTASAYHHAWLPPRCYVTQRFVFALLWILALVSFIGVLHMRWPILMGQADRRRRECCRLLTLIVVTIQAVLGIVLTDDAELAFLYRLFLIMIVLRGLRHLRDLIYAKLLPLLNRESLTTRATFPP
jgi:hypothetical protein